VVNQASPVRWTGQQAVMTLPEQIDVSNAGQIREALLSVINRGATSLIADMSATMSCDYAFADAVARASRRAILTGTELRLVVTAQIVRRVLSTSGLDRLVAIYPSLESAAAARAPAVAAWPTGQGRGAAGRRTGDSWEWRAARRQYGGRPGRDPADG
jgi:anti-anti-sigma factor